MQSKHYLPAGGTAEGPWSLVVTPDSAGWGFSGLRVLALDAGAAHTFGTGDEEMLVLPLSGSATVDCDGASFALAGRAGVFAGPSDFAYLPRDAEVSVRSADGARLAVCTARTDERLTARYGPAAGVEVQLRGAGNCSRQVHNYCMPGTFDAAKLLVCEVYTPAGNWSSYPPHKHDEDRDGESQLEEIYYFEVADGPTGGPGVAYQRVYGHPGKEIDVLEEVRSGDVVLIPHGWHGPSMAVPGFDLYYLNVMAGPSADRAWLICDDPAHGWVRDTWADQPVDPRLPMGASE